MPKPVKKAAKFKTPPKPKRPSDPNRAGHAVLTEHLARIGDSDPTGQPQDFKEQLSAYMAKLGAKGGKISGAKRMEMPANQRKAIAKKAASARWRKKS